MVICGTEDTFNACDDAKNGGVSQTNVWVPQDTCSNQEAQRLLYDIC